MADDWITAREAAKLLKVTERMVGHYGVQGKLQIKREGRRVWYFSEDVQKLASELRTDLRPAQLTRQDVSEAAIAYIQQLQQTNREVQEQRQQTEQEMLERLARIEAHFDRPAPAPAPVQPRGPSWQVIATLAIVLAIALVVLAIVIRLS